MDYNFEFQQDCVEQLYTVLEKNSVVILKGPEGSGKTTVANKISIEGYTSLNLTGEFSDSLTELAPFKKLSIFKNIKLAKNILDSAEVLASLFPISPSSGTLVDRWLNIDAEKIIKYFAESNQNFLLIIDSISKIDSLSIQLIQILIDNINCYRNLKILIVDDQENIFNSHSIPEINIQSLTPKDLKLLDYKFKPSSNLLSIPVSILIYLKRENKITDLDYKEFLQKDLNEKMNKSNINWEHKLVVKLVNAHSNFSEMKWVSIKIIAQYMLRYNILYTEDLIVELVNLGIFEEENNYVRLSNIYISIPKENYIETNSKEEIYIYLDYLEKHAPFLYYEKYKNYKLIGNHEQAYLNAFLHFSTTVKEKGISSVSPAIINFLKNYETNSAFVVLEQALKYYTQNYYMECFHELDSFIESQKNSGEFIYSSEIFAELSYFWALSLARKVTSNIDDGTRKITLEDVKFLKKLSMKNRNNVELSLRIKQAILILSLEIHREQKNWMNTSAPKLFNEIYENYSAQITYSIAKYKNYWQYKRTIFLAKIEMLENISDDSLQKTLEKCTYILEKEKEKYPSSYIKTASNYSTLLFWNGNSKQAEEITEKIICFIEKLDIDPTNWGVVYLLQLIYNYLEREIVDDTLFKRFNNLIWNNSDALRKLHEHFLCISNYSLLLYEYTGDIIQPIKNIERALESKTKTNYDEYVLRTNLGLLYFINGQNAQASLEEKRCSQLIKERVPYVWQYMIYRNEELLRLYSSKKNNDLNFTNEIVSIQKVPSSCSRLVFFSDIAYWSD
jgi:hypothetical protein